MTLFEVFDWLETTALGALIGHITGGADSDSFRRAEQLVERDEISDLDRTLEVEHQPEMKLFTMLCMPKPIPTPSALNDSTRLLTS